jgi:hypothetical protein
MFKDFLVVVAVLLFADAFMCFLWLISGQTPVDDFYFGSITAHIIKFIFF